MKSLLLRTVSSPVQQHSFAPGSPRVSLSVLDSIANNCSASPRISVISRRRDSKPARGIRRALSESDMVRSETHVCGGFSSDNGVGSRSFPAKIPEEQYQYLSDHDEGEGVGCIGSMRFDDNVFDRRNYAAEGEITTEELGFPGGGIGNGITTGGGGDDDCPADDRKKIGAYYQEMLKLNPSNSLLLRNYGRFLHKVERETVKAEEYYGRAILASPGDGEVLSLYGKLIWETQRDEDRAKSYFDQAVRASPDDCTVLGSYAKFMWEAEEENDAENGDGGGMGREKNLFPAMVAAF